MPEPASLIAAAATADRRPAFQGAAFAAVLALAMALPMLLLYAVGVLGPDIVRDLGIAPGSLGAFTLGSFGVAALLSLFAGPLVERIGPRNGLCGLFLAVAVAYAVAALCPGFAGLLAAMAVAGVAQALCNPVTNLLIARQVAPAARARMVGLKQAGVQGAALFAGLVLPATAQLFGWRGALAPWVLLSLVLAGTALAVARRSPAGPTEPARALAPVRPNRRLAVLMAVQGAVGMGLSVFVTFTPLHATQQGLPGHAAGALIAAFGVVGMLSRVVLTPLAARLRDESPLLAGLLLAAAVACGCIALGSGERQALLWTGAVLMGASAAATNAIAMSMLLRDPGFGPAAASSGLLSAAFFGGFAVGPPGAGHFVSAAGGFGTVWIGVMGVLCCGALAALALARLRRGTRP